MKTIFYLILLLLLTTSCTERTVKYTYGPRLVDIVWEGDRSYEVYSSDSVVEFKQEYKNGKLDFVTEWGNDGALWFKTDYKNGVMHGKHIAYDREDSTKIWYIHYYKNGMLLKKKDFR